MDKNKINKCYNASNARIGKGLTTVAAIGASVAFAGKGTLGGKMLAGAKLGAKVGAASGGMKTYLKNKAYQKKGKAAWKGVGKSALVGGAVGGIAGGVTTGAFEVGGKLVGKIGIGAKRCW